MGRKLIEDGTHLLPKQRVIPLHLVKSERNASLNPIESQSKLASSFQTWIASEYDNQNGWAMLELLAHYYAGFFLIERSMTKESGLQEDLAKFIPLICDQFLAEYQNSTVNPKEFGLRE